MHKPGRVFKNKHQPGQMGTEVITVPNTKIVDINLENVIAVKGSVPGCRRSLVEIRESNRVKNRRFKRGRLVNSKDKQNKCP